MRLFPAKNLLLCLCFVALASFCVREEVASCIEAEKTELEFSSSVLNIEGKTQIENSINILWNQGDDISICEKIAAEGQKGATFTAQSSGESVTFKGQAPKQDNYYALSPASAVKYWKADGSASVFTNLPYLQRAICNNADPAALLMCAKTPKSQMQLNFKVIVALVKFTIDSSSPAITSISINAPGQYLVGSSAVNTSYSSPSLAGTGSKTSNVFLSKEDGSVFEPGDYYIAVIPRTYSSLNFTFTDKYGLTSKKSMTDVTFEAGKVYSAGEIPDLFEAGSVERYNYSTDVPRSELYSVIAGEAEHLVYPTDEAHICCFGAKESVSVYVRKEGVVPASVSIRPSAKNYSCTIEGDLIKLSLAPYDRVSVEINGDIDNPLFIFVNPFETDKPSKTDSKVKYFSAGYYNSAHSGINLTNTGKKVLYLEGGAVVKTNIAATDDSDIEIRGYGIIDARGTTAIGINFMGTSGIDISGITLVNAPTSSTRFTECSDISCDNYKVVATENPYHKSGAENDAFDFFGCHDVKVSRCFGYCHDDVYIIASKSLSRGFGGPTYGFSFSDCIGWNVKAGNTFEIGYATALDVSDVTFKDCYSIHSNNNRVATSQFTKGAMAIHSCSYGTVKDVTFENIHIEDPYCYTTILEIKKSPFDDLPDYKGGHIKNITFKDIHISKDGPDHSVFKGYDSEHCIDGVQFINYNLAGKRAASMEDAGIVSYSNSYNISFDGGEPFNPRQIETYSYSSELASSEVYNVYVEGLGQFVYPTNTLETYDEQLHICAFGCKDEVTVCVSPKSGTVASATVRPKSINFSSNFANNTLTLKMKPCDRAIVEFDNDNKHPLFLFANEFEQKPSSATHYFKAGQVYDHDQIKLNTGETIYIEGGAVVHTTVRSNKADNISIKGAGIIDASEISAYSIHLRRFNNLEISGICTIGRDASIYWLATGNGLTMHNTKGIALFSRRNPSGNENDALDLISCCNTNVTKGFSYSHDDCCIVKANVTNAGSVYEGPSKNITVDDFISAYRDSGHGCGIGYSCFDEVRDVTFRNIYVPYDNSPRVSYSKKGQLAVHNTGSGTVSDITFENVHLEQASKGQAFFLSIFKYADYDYGETGYVPGKIQGVTFKNIYLDAAPEYGNYLIGYDDAEHKITGISFENLYFGNQKILNRTDARFTDGILGGYDRTRFKFTEEPSFN